MMVWEPNIVWFENLVLSATGLRVVSKTLCILRTSDNFKWFSRARRTLSTKGETWRHFVNGLLENAKRLNQLPILVARRAILFQLALAYSIIWRSSGRTCPCQPMGQATVGDVWLLLYCLLVRKQTEIVAGMTHRMKWREPNTALSLYCFDQD